MKQNDNLRYLTISEACNLHMCSDWELNPRPFVYGTTLQPIEPHWPGLTHISLRLGHTPREDHVKTQWEDSIFKSKRRPEELNTVIILILDFWLPEPWGNILLLLKPSSLQYFVMATQQTYFQKSTPKGFRRRVKNERSISDWKKKEKY